MCCDRSRIPFNKDDAMSVSSSYDVKSAANS